MKKVAKLFLYNQNCYLVDTEVKLNKLGLYRYCELDEHTVIDVLGIGLKYKTMDTQDFEDKEFDYFNLENPSQYLLGYNVLRGIEVKISRSDYRNGFICHGCNYNYLLTPIKLLAPHEVPKGVGLIEFNKYKFSCELIEDGKTCQRPFKIIGLRVLKRPMHRNIPRFQIDNAIARISLRQKEEDILDTYKTIKTDVNRISYNSCRKC